MDKRFLADRSQCVVIEHCFSEWLPVISGVPQGSVLGPVLFILYIDDINAVFSNSTVTYKLFADDCKMYSTINTDLDYLAALDRLQQWSCDWQLSINVSKCHILHLGKKNNQKKYFLNGCVIVTDLGVEIDLELKCDKHIHKIVGKAYSRVGMILKGLPHVTFRF